ADAVGCRHAAGVGAGIEVGHAGVHADIVEHRLLAGVGPVVDARRGRTAFGQVRDVGIRTRGSSGMARYVGVAHQISAAAYPHRVAGHYGRLGPLDGEKGCGNGAAVRVAARGGHVVFEGKCRAKGYRQQQHKEVVLEHKRVGN
nr:hypothetical protein [Tanacetum cinerariifolium]